jgi:exonuclease VII small subunit
MDKVDVALNYVIDAVRDGYQLSEEQTQKLKEVLPGLSPTSTKVEGKKEFLDHVRKSLFLSNVGVKSREESIMKVRKAIDKVKALESDKEAVKLLSTCSDSNASTQLRQIREKMENFLHRLESGETFPTSGVVGAINKAMRNLTQIPR